jgi:diguanylate cyclase (GGDEF)-like protein/PAS domain S-box-containing protein
MESLEILKEIPSRLLKRFGRALLPPNVNKGQGRSLADRVISEIGDAIVVTDHNLKIIEINPAFTNVTGYTREEVIGQTPSLLSSGQHDSDFYKGMWRSIDEKGEWKGTIWNRKKNGDIFPEWLVIRSISDSRGIITNYLGTFSDLSHKSSSNNPSHLLAYYDNLTGLPNRALFSDRLKLLIAQAKREMQTIAIFFLDLYKFKSINDSMGHAIGDQVLISIAERLNESLRDSDTVARLSGDEFCVITSGIKSRSHATAIAEKILECFKKPIIIGQREIYTGTSIGISLYPDHGGDAETLLRHADSAMYSAKERGNNHYFIYDISLISKHEQRIKFENDLSTALQENQLELIYQPQIDINTGKVTAIETFTRWKHHKIGAVSPVEFISIANETGLIYQLGNWILDNSCKQMANWRNTTGLDIRLSVNVTAKQLSSGRFPDRVASALKKSGLPSEALELEISENTLSDSCKEIFESLRKINELGVQTTIDDFGIGHASLCDILDLSINKLKIDKSLIAKLSAKSSDQVLVNTIINLSHNLYLTTCASGVETREQFHILRSMGCDLAQGFLIHQPMQEDEMTSALLSEIKFSEKTNKVTSINFNKLKD